MQQSTRFVEHVVGERRVQKDDIERFARLARQVVPGGHLRHGSPLGAQRVGIDL